MSGRHARRRRINRDLNVQRGLTALTVATLAGCVAPVSNR